jgi:hypothetical protein
MYLVKVFYQPDPQSSCKLQEEKIFKTLQEAKIFANKWHPCAYVTRIYERKEEWFPV